MKMQRKQQILSNNLPLSYQDVDDDYALVDVVVSTGAAVYHREKDETGSVFEFERSLEISEDAIRLDRFKSGAPVLDNHNDGTKGDSVNRTLGSVDKVWIEGSGENACLMARLKLSKITKEDREVAQKVKSGIITGVSVGAEIHSQRNISTSGEGIHQILADDWEPYEVSLVMVPADKKAIIRSKGVTMSEGFSEAQLSELSALMKQMLEEHTSMKEKNMEEDEEEEKEESMKEKNMGDKEKKMEEDEEEEEENMKEKKSKDSDASEVSQLSKKVSQLTKLMKQMHETPEESIVKRPVRVSLDSSNTVKRMSLMTDSLADLATGGAYSAYKAKKGEKVEDENEYRGQSIAEVALNYLRLKNVDTTYFEQRSGRDALYRYIISEPQSRRPIIKRGNSGPIHVTDDFKDLVESSMEKAVLMSYENQRGKQTFDSFVTRKTVTNFKDNKRPAIGESGELMETPPGSPPPMFITSVESEEYALSTYAKTFQLTRQAFVDDDTGEIEKVVTSGLAAADLESKLVYEEMLTGTVGGKTWYHADHNNLKTGANPLGSGTTPYAGLKAIRVGLATQKGRSLAAKNTPLNLQFGTLLVPAQLEFEALQTLNVQYPAVVTSPNPYASMYNIVVEPRLASFTGGSQTAYYGFAKEIGPGHTFMELGSLSRGPFAEYSLDPHTQVMQWTLIYDVGVKVLDYRLAYKVNGA